MSLFLPLLLPYDLKLCSLSRCLGKFYYEGAQSHRPPQTFKLLSATGEAVGEIKMLIVSRLNEMFPPLSALLNKTCVTMLSHKSWGLVDSLQPDIIDIVRSLIFKPSDQMFDVSMVTVSRVPYFSLRLVF